MGHRMHPLSLGTSVNITFCLYNKYCFGWFTHFAVVASFHKCVTCDISWALYFGMTRGLFTSAACVTIRSSRCCWWMLWVMRGLRCKCFLSSAFCYCINVHPTSSSKVCCLLMTSDCLAMLPGFSSIKSLSNCILSARRVSLSPATMRYLIDSSWSFLYLQFSARA